MNTPKRLIHALAVILAVFGALAPAAVAQTGADKPASAEPGAMYQSPQREMCEAELAKDKVWWAELKIALRPEVHEEEANLITTNNRHVVIAYAALWMLAVLFIVLLWLRQSALIKEIARLEAEVRRAAEE